MQVLHARVVDLADLRIESADGESIVQAAVCRIDNAAVNFSHNIAARETYRIADSIAVRRTTARNIAGHDSAVQRHGVVVRRAAVAAADVHADVFVVVVIRSPDADAVVIRRSALPSLDILFFIGIAGYDAAAERDIVADMDDVVRAGTVAGIIRLAEVIAAAARDSARYCYAVRNGNGVPLGSAVLRRAADHTAADRAARNGNIIL